MHKFLRSVGFSDIRKRDLEMIIKDIVKAPGRIKVTRDSEENEFAELSKEFAPNMGITVCGTYDDNDQFEVEYYYPFFYGSDITTQECIEVEKHSEKESYAGVCDDARIGVTLIFYLQNAAEYLSELNIQQKSLELNGAVLSALASDGVVILPIEKTEHKEKNANHKYNERSKLIAQAREGDEEAIENLTIEDMDMYSLISKRIQNEDVLSIVTSYFMPYGIESDQYSILGEILEYSKEKNTLTGEELYCMKVNCNDLIFDVCINAKNLMGEPKCGRRFKGNIWMQGSVNL